MDLGRASKLHLLDSVTGRSMGNVASEEAAPVSGTRLTKKVSFRRSNSRTEKPSSAPAPEPKPKPKPLVIKPQSSISVDGKEYVPAPSPEPKPSTITIDGKKYVPQKEESDKKKDIEKKKEENKPNILTIDGKTYIEQKQESVKKKENEVKEVEKKKEEKKIEDSPTILILDGKKFQVQMEEGDKKKENPVKVDEKIKEVKKKEEKVVMREDIPDDIRIGSIQLRKKDANNICKCCLLIFLVLFFVIILVVVCLQVMMYLGNNPEQNFFVNPKLQIEVNSEGWICDDGWAEGGKPLGVGCLWFEKTPMFFFDAINYCKNNKSGSRLVEVHSVGQMNFVRTALKNETQLLKQSGLNCDLNQFVCNWFGGGYDLLKEGNWVWQHSFEPLQAFVWNNQVPPSDNIDFNNRLNNDFFCFWRRHNYYGVNCGGVANAEKHNPICQLTR